ncbi:MAG: nitroreductase family protein [Rubrivivax sp.]|nr:nitroreductase family protein [Rubrivivax sp.]
MTEPWPSAWDNAQLLIASRHNVSPKRLVEPGPDEVQLQALLGLAAAAPDHQQLTPWRFVIVPPARRPRLGEVFALALADRDASATAQQLEQAREKALRAPLLMVAVARLGPRDPDVPALERMVSLGAAIQNIALGAHALGYGCGLTSGQALSSPRLRELLRLGEGEAAVCCVNIGTVSKHKASSTTRPEPGDFTSTL